MKPTSRVSTQKEINNLKKCAESFVDEADKDISVFDDDDHQQYCFEQVMEMFYDKDIWKKINTRVEEGYWP